MKPRYLSLIFLCAMAVAQCSPTTANLGLATPPYNASGWNTCLNTNFTILDNYLSGTSILPAFKAAGLTLSGTGLTSNTGSFSGNVSVGGNLSVTGTFTGTLSVTNLSLSGTLGVAGASTLTGNTTVGGTLGVTGQITDSVATSTPPFIISSTTPVLNLTAANHPTVFDCGGSGTCANTMLTNPRLVTGFITMSGGTATVSSITAFTTEARCTVGDATGATAVKISAIVSVGVTTLTINAGTSDVIYYNCTGY